jgi:predicted nucleotidyltransferase component of viral defense system
MTRPELTRLQLDILRALSGVEPPWTLTGGAALAGVHLGHRSTRDLDLFWHGATRLDTVVETVEDRLARASMQVEARQRTSSFVRLVVRRGEEATVVDLVAEPVEGIEAPVTAALDDFTVLVDTPHEILVNKLNALLSRSEIRDLVDVRALLARGGDLDRAVHDAASKDAGFSATTLAWVLRGLPVEALVRASDMPAAEGPGLQAFRDELVARLTAETSPG